MTCSQWNYVILFLLLCRWSNFKIGTFRQVTAAAKCFLAWQMCLALKWDLWISVTKGACCLVLIVRSDQSTNGRPKLFPSHLRMFWLKFRWRLVFFDLLELYMNSSICLGTASRQNKQFSESCWVEAGCRRDLVPLQSEPFHTEMKGTRSIKHTLSEFDSVSQLQGWI